MVAAPPRDWVLITSIVAGTGAPVARSPGLTSTVTGVAASTCTPLSMAPVRSSATMARATGPAASRVAAGTGFTAA